jgi:hypothetical protein
MYIEDRFCYNLGNEPNQQHNYCLTGCCEQLLHTLIPSIVALNARII